MVPQWQRSQFVGTATLEGYELAFVGDSATWGGGVATVRRVANGVVAGVVWRNVDFEAMDRYEGHPYAYQRIGVDVQLDHDRLGWVQGDPFLNLRCETYIKVSDTYDALPTRRYVEALVRGYEAFDMGEAAEALSVAHAGSDRLFVYGSLMHGLGNHRHLKGATWVGPALTSPSFDLFDLGAFPALVEGGARQVFGEVYEVTPEQLELIDQLEGHPTFYRRRAIDLGEHKAHMYVLDRARAESMGQPINASEAQIIDWSRYIKGR